MDKNFRAKNLLLSTPSCSTQRVSETFGHLAERGKPDSPTLGVSQTLPAQGLRLPPESHTRPLPGTHSSSKERTPTASMSNTAPELKLGGRAAPVGLRGSELAGPGSLKLLLLSWLTDGLG